MSSSLFNSFLPQNNLGNMSQMINQINQFRSTFRGNPQTQVQELLRSGKLSQQKFNEYAQIANQLRSLIK